VSWGGSLSKKYKEYTPEELDKLVLDTFRYYSRDPSQDELEEEELINYFMKFAGMNEWEAEHAVHDAESECILDGYGLETSGGRNVVYQYVYPEARKEKENDREYVTKREIEKIEREDEDYPG